MSELKVHASLCKIEPMVQSPEEIRASFARRLKTALSIANINEWGAGVRLAEISGKTAKAASKWLNGESMPGRANMKAIADLLGVRIEWLQFGEGPPQKADGLSERGSGEANVSPALQPTKSYSYPEISWVQAGEAAEAMDLLHTGDYIELHSSEEWAGDNGFWLAVKGPSMTSPSGGDSFPEGVLVLVAPSIQPENGQYVVAKRVNGHDHEATFKQYFHDAGQQILKPLNPEFGTIKMDHHWEFVGTVIDAKLPKRTFRRK